MIHSDGTIYFMEVTGQKTVTHKSIKSTTTSIILYKIKYIFLCLFTREKNYLVQYHYII